MMPKNYILRFAFFLWLVMLSSFSIAQTPAKPVAKYKPPVVKTYLGNDTGIGTKISVAEGKQIIALPLKIIDAKNNIYPITSYQFSYKRIGIVEDDSTGVTTPQSDMVAARFRDTPLSTVWITTIQDELHSGEELYFFDIVAKDKDGKIFFAPELKLVIE
jgi:hypothetical protein